MICPNCKNELADNAKFCQHCGKEIILPIEENVEQQVEPSKPEKTRICKVCGKEIPESAICCPLCGKFAGGIKKENLLPQNKAKPAPTVNKKYCKACGKSIPKSSFYCPLCNKIADTAPAPVTAETNGMALAGFILSFFVPILGLIFGIIGLNKANNGADRRGLALAAIIISAISMALTLLSYLIVLSQLGSLLTYY